MTELSLKYIKYKDRDPRRFGKIIIESLEPRVGLTYGNALRRVLLSSMPGKGMVAVRIEGIVHEFSTIPGVKDDITDIIQNLKKIVWKGPVRQGVQTAFIQLTGPGEVTGADFISPPGLEVVNKELKITTLASSARLELQVDIADGKGWSSCEDNKDDTAPISTIFTDTDFNPIEYVGYSVQPILLEGKRRDRLWIEIETDGSIAPDHAACLAAKILMVHTSLLGELKVGMPELPQEETKVAVNNHLQSDITELSLSARSKNCLKYTDIKTIGDLVNKTVDELIEIKNFGKKSLTEIREKLLALELHLKNDEGWADSQVKDEDNEGADKEV